MDVRLRVTKVLENGKRRFDREDKERLIEACLEPGVSLARLALDHNVNANQLRNWVTKRRREKAMVGRPQEERACPAPAFIPIIEATPVTDPPAVGGGALAPVGPRERSGPARQRSSRMRLRVSMPNGVKLELEGGDAPMVSAMIGALGRCDVPSGD